jgi:hypothetical protein
MYRPAGAEYGVPWPALAAIGAIETDHGRSDSPGVRSGLNTYGCCAGTDAVQRPRRAALDLGPLRRRRQPRRRVTSRRAFRVVAIRLVVGFISTVVWIFFVAALVAAGLWARSTLKSARRKRAVKRPSPREVTAAPSEDPVAVEMRRITEQLREQGRR